MNKETIEDEVYDFIDEYFDEELSLIDENLDFIENNKLFLPKLDYTQHYQYLSNTLKQFLILDPTFVTSVVEKLKDDIHVLLEVYENFEKKSKNIDDIFISKFSKHSPIINNYTKAMLMLKKEQSYSSNILSSDLQHVKTNYEKLKEIYAPMFTDYFHESSANIHTNLKICINTKLFYFDRLLWKYAKRSYNIVKHMQIRKMEGEFSSETYLKFIMSIMRPYTNEYKYLEKCLKVYR